jgi:hypothetical protein
MNGAIRCVDAHGNPMDFCPVGVPGAAGDRSGVRPGFTTFGGYSPDPLRDRGYEYNKAGYLQGSYDSWRAQFQRWRNPR